MFYDMPVRNRNVSPVNFEQYDNHFLRVQLKCTCWDVFDTEFPGDD